MLKCSTIPLVKASEYGHVEIVERLLTAHENSSVLLDVDAIDSSNRNMTAAMMASRYNHVRILKLLVAAGARLNVKDFNGSTALMKVRVYMCIRQC